MHGPRQFPEGGLAHSRIGQSVQQGHQVGQGFGSIARTREVLGKLRIRLLESMDRLQSDKMQAQGHLRQQAGAGLSAAASVIARLTASSGSCLIADASK